MSGTDVRLDVQATPDRVACLLACDGKAVTVTFTDGNVEVDLPENSS